MSAEVVNLRQARKRRALADKETAAAANRSAFGRTKAERELTRRETERTERTLAGHRRDDNEDK
jgi:Domain of unknown function (DUF4169)